MIVKAQCNQPTAHVVESRKEVADSMRAMLESAGLRVEVHGSCAALAQAVDARRSGCLVLDLDPPSNCDIDIFDDLAAHGINLPTIVITWSIDDCARERANLADVVAILKKPISDTTLLSAIDGVFDKGRQG
jgi:FixJ family two-component response regulator